MALENNKELMKQARLGMMDGEKGVRFLASEVVRIQGQDGLNYSEKPYFRSALWEATWKNNEPAVRYLIDKRADVNFKDRDGRTPLHEAARYGHTALVELLLESSADINTLDGWVVVTTNAGESALFQAVCARKHDAVALLVSKGAIMNSTDSAGMTVQHLAAFAGEPQMADWLFYKGAWKNRSKRAAVKRINAIYRYAVEEGEVLEEASKEESTDDDQQPTEDGETLEGNEEDNVQDEANEA
ncbi:E3 ubiquitin-protein ligase mib1 [Perkinsus chesapeaki]|uniref:E3 ubiquitin-protein ligase mib1 n=1 Tax=Perkinsus chesapeaki TaxID=330153 RepID=A0A7J6M2Z8_PERCH|nr:E3 ubiquitin-protein ligase mib1 [Perkinsus chesapeaki]